MRVRSKMVFGVAALALTLGGAGTSVASAHCGTGVTAYTSQGVRLYSVKSVVSGKSRVRLLACSTANPLPKTLAQGPPSRVKFGAFHTSGHFVSWEVIGVQSEAGAAGAGTNYNVGWVNSQTGLVRMNFLFVTPILLPHRIAVDPKLGSIAFLFGSLGSHQILYEADYNPVTKDFVGHDKHFINGGDWNLLDIPEEDNGGILPASLTMKGGEVHYRTSSGRSEVIDPNAG